MTTRVDNKILKFYLWVGLLDVFLGFLTTIGPYRDRFFAVIVNNVWAVSYLLVINFLLFERTIPFILKKRSSVLINIIVAALSLFVFLMAYSFGSYLWRKIGILLNVFTPLREFASIDALLENQMGYSVGSVFLFGICRHLYNHFRLRQRGQQLLIEKQTAELNYLRSQTNPHFLFNTLNNIYSLARDKSNLTAESILRLSKILRFTLYETQGNYVSIERELQIIQDYIDLEKLRYDESLVVNFNYNVEDMKQAIPPLLLIPLVENAFKHGVSETRSEPYVDVHLSINDRLLIFVVKNSADLPAAELPLKESIGLSNLRRQLELLYKDYSLAMSPSPFSFTVIMKINLASHV